MKAGSQKAQRTAGEACDGRGHKLLEEGDGADRWAPLVSDWERERQKTGRAVLRWAAKKLGRARAGPRGRGKERPTACCDSGRKKKKKAGRAEK